MGTAIRLWNRPVTMRRLAAALLCLTVPPAFGAEGPSPALKPAVAARFAKLALACIHREFPNKIAHVLSSPKDARPPSQLTPAFYGCYDWHSAVHGHWLLARLVRL